MEFSLLGLRLKDTKEEIPLFNNVLTPCSSINDIVSLPSNKNNGDVCEHQCDFGGDVEHGNVTHDDCGDVTCGEYDLYTKIETHMSFSASLYILNRQGVAILQELEAKKVTRKDQKVVADVPGKIYTEMVQCVNVNRISSDLYTSLLSLLDDVLFDECGELDTFYVKEEEYTLESLYYKQGSWVDEIEWHEPQYISFNKSVDIDEGECMYMLMFLKKYLSLLVKIENEYDNHKLHACLDKLRFKLTTAHDVLVDVLETFMKECT